MIGRFDEVDALWRVIGLVCRRVVEQVDAIIAANRHRNLRPQEGEAAVRAGIGRATHANRCERPRLAAVARFTDKEVDGAFGLPVLCVACPGKIDIALRVDARAATERPALLRAAIVDEIVIPGLAPIMGDGGINLLYRVVGYGDRRTAHGQFIFVGRALQILYYGWP